MHTHRYEHAGTRRQYPVAFQESYGVSRITHSPDGSCCFSTRRQPSMCATFSWGLTCRRRQNTLATSARPVPHTRRAAPQAGIQSRVLSQPPRVTEPTPRPCGCGLSGLMGGPPWEGLRRSPIVTWASMWTTRLRCRLKRSRWSGRPWPTFAERSLDWANGVLTWLIARSVPLCEQVAQELVY